MAAVLNEIAPFIAENLKKVGRAGVCIEISGDFCYNKSDNLESLSVNVASDRIDAVLAAVTRLSREKAVRLITEGKVRLNFLAVTDKSLTVKGDEKLSVAGYGRFQLCGYTGQSRKGRLYLAVNKYR
jgi:RNA-binding protein YlmH